MANTQRSLIVILAVSLVVSSGCTEKTGDAASSMTSEQNRKEAVIKGNYQEVELTINASGYSPNVIIAKRNIPLKIYIYSEDESGHSNKIVFPDFGIEKTVFPGSRGLIEILPSQEGTYKFRCPMDMVSGELIIK